MAPAGLQRIISGGQAGVDRAALLAAASVGIGTGGFVPKARLAEDGPIPEDILGLQETDTTEPAFRTRLNVNTSDATLIILDGKQDAGTRLTVEIALILGKPLLELNLPDAARPDRIQTAIARVHRFLAENAVRDLNIAGPRESNSPGIQIKTQRFLVQAFAKEPSDSVSNYPIACGPAEKLAHLEHGLASLRHWDSVRWLVPFWYLTASGTAAAETGKLQPALAIAIGLSLVLVGLAALHLVGRTIVYNNEQITRLRAIGAALDLHRIGSINFALSGWRTPATLVFMFLMALSTLAWLVWTLGRVFILFS